jgi:hypothetical protein
MVGSAMTRSSRKRRYGGGDSQKKFTDTSLEQRIQTTAAFNEFQLFQHVCKLNERAFREPQRGNVAPQALVDNTLRNFSTQPTGIGF